MSYEIAFYQPDDDPDDPDAGEHFFLCSTSSWSAFLRWVATLPEDRYPALVRFCNDGCITGTDLLSTHLRRALRSRRPESAGVLATGRALLSHTGIGAPDETAALEM